MKSLSDSVLRRIRAKRPGWVFTPKDFIDLAARDTIGVILHRLVKRDIIRRLSQGLYDFPIKHSKLGALAPSPDAISKALAARSGDKILRGGSHVANQLGLDTQVAAKASFITSGKSIRKNVVNYPITLNHSKYISKIKLNDNVINLINALKYIGKKNINDDILSKCRNHLSPKDISQIKKNLNQFPDWIIKILHKMDVL